jgi:phytoene dehydrogenase-like protein
VNVTVIEREEGPGGRAASCIAMDFSFDIGPTELTTPGLIDLLSSPRERAHYLRATSAAPKTSRT